MSHSTLPILAFFRSEVNYGATASYGSSTTKDSKLVTYHKPTITGHSPGTIHHFQVVSTDGTNNYICSKDVSGLQYRVYRASGTCDWPGSLTGADRARNRVSALPSDHSGRISGVHR
jgi:hypothetical protein